MEVILSDDEMFYAWVESYFESVRSDADLLDADAFAP